MKYMSSSSSSSSSMYKTGLACTLEQVIQVARPRRKQSLHLGFGLFDDGPELGAGGFSLPPQKVDVPKAEAEELAEGRLGDVVLKHAPVRQGGKLEEALVAEPQHVGEH
jgi:hypothetical protein